jgi:hypothetical protein
MDDSAARPEKTPYDTHEERASAAWHIFYNTREKGWGGWTGADPSPLLPLVYPHPSPGLYQRRLDRRVGVPQAQMQVCVLRIGEPVAGVGLQGGQLPRHTRKVAG